MGSEEWKVLRTRDEQKIHRLGKSVGSSLQSKQVSEDDVVRIDAETGRITRMGESRGVLERGGPVLAPVY